MTDAPESIFDRIAKLLPADSREHFYRRMAHLRDLSPEDDMLQIAEAMGFLALITRQIPDEVAAERVKIGALFEDAVAALKLAHDNALAYHRELDRRLEKLPADIALALNAESIAALLSESIRQRFHETGLPALSETIAAHAQVLRNSSFEFAKAVETFADSDHGTVARVHRTLSSMHADLNNAADHVRTIARSLAKDLQATVALFSLVALMLGFLLGIQWAKQH